jgi:hypothetical protein
MPSYKNCLTGSESKTQTYPDLSIRCKDGNMILKFGTIFKKPMKMTAYTIIDLYIFYGSIKCI